MTRSPSGRVVGGGGAMVPAPYLEISCCVDYWGSEELSKRYWHLGGQPNICAQVAYPKLRNGKEEDRV